MDIAGIDIFWALAGGVISFLSPCVLPLVPAYVSYIAGRSLEDLAQGGSRQARWGAVLLSVCFVAGFTTIFVLLGAAATSLGRVLLTHLYELNIAAGIVVILFGVLMMGAVRIPVLQRDMRFHLDLPGGRPLGAYVLGAAFAFGWTPCIGPILGGILTMAGTKETVGSGVLLLSVYSLGLGVPFVAAAAFTGRLLVHLRRLGRAGRWLQLVAGGILVLMGIAMITGWLSDFAFWILELFPGLATVG